MSCWQLSLSLFWFASSFSFLIVENSLMLIFFQALLILSVFWRTGFSRSTAHSLVVPWRHFPADPYFRAAWLQHVQQLFKSLTKGAEYLLCLETVKNPQDIAMSSFILPRVSRRTSKRHKKTAANNNQLSAVCQTSFPIPDTDTVANWPSLFHLNQLMDVLALEKGSEMQHWWLEQLRSMLLLCLLRSNYSKPD